jgi:hypothetical protein
MKSDRNQEYMMQMWGTNQLATDYNSLKTSKVNEDHDCFLQEIVDHRHNFKDQNKLHEKIRNDIDYDDWGYGTEPSYGKVW